MPRIVPFDAGLLSLLLAATVASSAPAAAPAPAAYALGPAIRVSMRQWGWMMSAGALARVGAPAPMPAAGASPWPAVVADPPFRAAPASPPAAGKRLRVLHRAGRCAPLTSQRLR